jgi:hypothetical protein
LGQQLKESIADAFAQGSPGEKIGVAQVVNGLLKLCVEEEGRCLP